MNNEGPDFRFPKREKLVGKKNIEELFRRGSSFYLYPLLLKYRAEPDPSIPWNRALFTVSKKHFKKAVDRNLIKRRMRESYRLHKQLISHPGKSPKYHVAFVYLDKTILPYGQIEEKLKVLLQRLEKKQSNQDPSVG